jgi:hypothetical protein
MAGVVEGLIGILQTYANAIEGTSANWDSPKLTPVTRKGVSQNETTSSKVWSYKTARSNQIGVVQKMFANLGRGEAMAMVEIAKPAFTKQQNKFKTRLKKVVSANLMSADDMATILQLDNQIIADCLAGKETDKNVIGQFDSMYADYMEKLKSVSTKKSSNEDVYEVPDYLVQHRDQLFGLYQTIVKTANGDPSKIELDEGSVVRLMSGIEIVNDRENASTPYNWKKKGRSRKS